MLNLKPVLSQGDALIIVPPFCKLNMPSYAVHLLQACARQSGIQVRVLYANQLLAAKIGVKNYRAITFGLQSVPLVGERFFSEAAFPSRLSPSSPSDAREYAHFRRNLIGDSIQLPWDEYEQLRSVAGEWVQEIAAALETYNFKVIGCTTSFEQTASSVALLNAIKDNLPTVITIIGGANCEDIMAEGIASLKAQIDYIFSGESEESFIKFMKTILADSRPVETIFPGLPRTNLDDLPLPDYQEYFQQREAFLGHQSGQEAWLMYESSRGCWWGQKHHCTFCGLNGLGMNFRHKSPKKVLDDLSELAAQGYSQRVFMVDNIMPYSYFKNLLHNLASKKLGLKIFYEQKANLSFDKVILLDKAGVFSIQPGIEALSTSLLRHIKKGVTSPMNIALLRYARSVGLHLEWSLLFGFPGDQLLDYQETLALLPLLRHLDPPKGCFQLSLDRFSPYFTQPQEYDIQNIRPLQAYHDVFPAGADINKLAYHFTAEYQSGSLENPSVIDEIRKETRSWQQSWRIADGGRIPDLTIYPLTKKSYLLLDSRGLPGLPQKRILNKGEAAVALTGRKMGSDNLLMWAIDSKIGVEIDGNYVPLAIAHPDILQSFENAHS